MEQIKEEGEMENYINCRVREVDPEKGFYLENGLLLSWQALEFMESAGEYKGLKYIIQEGRDLKLHPAMYQYLKFLNQK